MLHLLFKRFPCTGSGISEALAGILRAHEDNKILQEKIYRIIYNLTHDEEAFRGRFGSLGLCEFLALSMEAQCRHSSVPPQPENDGSNSKPLVDGSVVHNQLANTSTEGIDNNRKLNPNPSKQPTAPEKCDVESTFGTYEEPRRDLIKWMFRAVGGIAWHHASNQECFHQYGVCALVCRLTGTSLH
jgi:hypothetical protein